MELDPEAFLEESLSKFYMQCRHAKLYKPRYNVVNAII